MKTIAIIGAGFSGTMVAVHLMRLVRGAPTTIVLMERTGRFTAGVAYGTQCHSHLLNVPAGRMSAFPDDGDHFLRWAQQQNRAITGGTFVQRHLYGRYLAHVLEEADAGADAAVRLQRVPGEALGIQATPGQRLTIDLGGGGMVRADQVVLAVGNFPPADPPLEITSACEASDRYARDPWAADALNVSADSPVLLLGTGLTMLDVALALRDQKHRGPIIALSRRGLMPQPHRDSIVPPPHHDRPKSLDHWPRTALGLLRSLRAEVASAAAHGVDWREVITSLRADTPSLWQSLSRHERTRFLTHVRPFWETHRHRAATAIASQVKELIDYGQLRVMAGRVLRMRDVGDTLEVAIRRRHAANAQTLNVARVINCTGPDTNLARVPMPLIQDLRTSGMIRPDPLGLGLDTAPSGAIVSASGRPCERLYIVGPLRKGQLWENTAVPELRVEAQRLAEHLANVATRQIASIQAHEHDALLC